MLEGLKISLFIMTIIFFGTSLGGLATKFVSTFIRENYRYLHIFCGGILVGLLGLDVLSETVNSYNPLGVLAGLSLGIS